MAEISNGWRLMKDPDTRGMFQGISLHYYSVVNGWDNKGSATSFDEREWFETFSLNMEMDKLIRNHEAIMDRYDPAKTKGLIVDEWGNWFKVEPGTNPGFLYQQNTLRDALSAAIQLNIFNSHADRVRGANIAQIVNVLQSVILTNGDKMVLTPTYHVFRMFRVHQDARLIPVDLKCEDYVFGEKKIPAITASASVDKEGRLHISMANLNPGKKATVNIPVMGESFKNVTAEILTAGQMNAFNSFESPDIVKPASFSGFTFKNGILTVDVPSKSLIVIELSK
jgi:alpha-N-arabinofuranosidase